VLRIVQVEKMYPVEPECSQALLDRSAGLCGVKTICLGVSVELGRYDKALREAATLADHLADQLLASPKAIDARSVEEVGWPVKDGSYRFKRSIGADFIAICFGHAR
jgi:hypothetical protein